MLAEKPLEKVLQPYLKKKVSKILLSIFKSKKVRYKIWKLAEKKMTKYKIKDSEYITELCSGPYYMKKVYKKVANATLLILIFHNYKECLFQQQHLQSYQ